jgi:hypothetical protein
VQKILHALLKGHTMTSFTHSDFPTTHAGVNRIESAVRSAGHLGARFRGARGLVALLLAGGFSALVVVADQLVSTWADGQMVVAWMGLWVVLFGAVLLFAEASQGWMDQITRAMEGWLRTRAQHIADERTWQFALADPRFMTELQVARCRAENEAQQAGTAAPQWPFSHMPLQAARPPAHFR